MGLVEKFAVVEMGGTQLGVANYEAHARTRTVGPRTQHGPLLTRKILRLCTLLC